MSEPRQPAERFAIGEYIRDEMEERGWSAADLTMRACLVDDEDAYEVTLLALRLLMDIDDPGLLLDEDTARRLGKVFGVKGSMLMRLAALGRGET